MKFSLKRKYLAIPYVIFLALFVIVPIFVVLYYAFSNETGSPSFDSLVNFFTSPTKLNAIVISFFIAIQTTLICLLIGYPVAYILADKKLNKNAVMIMLFIAPMWINFVLRTWATREVLMWFSLGGSDRPYIATLIGMVYNFLPFCILPLYTTMLKLDRSQMEAAADLGCSPFKVFILNVIPQTLPGIISAITMTLVPVMSSYVISSTLSEGKITLIGDSIDLNFANGSWNDGAFMAFILLVLVIFSMLLSKNERTAESSRGGGLW